MIYVKDTNTLPNLPILTLAIEAPQDSVLTVADCEYLQGRIMHERHIAGLSKTPDEVMENAVRSYEATKTLLHALGLIMQWGSCDKIIVNVYPKNAEVIAHFHADNSLITLASYPYVHISGELTFKFVVGSRKNHFEVKGSKEYKDVKCKYPAHSSGILSYDMNFPAPTLFIHDVLRPIYDEYLKNAKIHTLISDTTSTSYDGWRHDALYGTECDPDWDMK